MLEADPSSRPKLEADIGKAKAFLATLVVVAFAIGGFFLVGRWRHADAPQPPPKSRFASLYQRYEMTPLPREAEDGAKVAEKLAMLTREPCNKTSIYHASTTLAGEARSREAIALLDGFAGHCPNAVGEIVYAGDLLYNLTDYQAALARAERALRLDPNANLATYLRARALKQLGRHEEALNAFAETLRSFPDLKNTRSEVFLSMASTFAALGKFCEAVSPIQTYIAIDHEKRDSPSLQKLIADYSQKGNCGQAYASGSESFPRKAEGPIKVKAVVNGVEGLFIVDTGASFVSLTPAFATRARLTPLQTEKTTLSSANGLVKAAVTLIPEVKLGRLRADAVPGVIMEKPLQLGEDGRFSVVFGEKELKIAAKPAK
ncbi:MAG TPA: aspartyl protease family protein [Methylocystis sp.]|nr:aspartyl protease family protein [Methylocystis sp.]